MFRRSTKTLEPDDIAYIDKWHEKMHLVQHCWANLYDELTDEERETLERTGKRAFRDLHYSGKYDDRLILNLFHTIHGYMHEHGMIDWTHSKYVKYTRSGFPIKKFARWAFRDKYTEYMADHI